MKKLKTILLSTLCLFFVGVTLSGCKDKGEFNLTQNTVSLKVEEKVDLLPFISLKDLTIDKLVIKSLDKNVAVVSPDYKIIGVGVGNTVIKVSYKENFKNISVVVKKDPIYLSVPTGLYFDSLNHKIIWNKVYGDIDGQTFLANSYTLEIQKEGETSFREIPINDKNEYYFDGESGTYTVKVKTNDRSDLILGSNYSRPITFTILETPTNLKFDKETNILSWNGNSEKYSVNINGGEKTIKASANSIKLELNEEKTYYISVNAEKDNDSSKRSEEIIITRLKKPVLEVRDGYLIWDRQIGISKYQLNINDGNTLKEVVLNGDEIRYKLDGNSYETNKEYKIVVKAIGQENYLDSNFSNEVVVEKLKQAQLSYDIKTKTLSVVGAVLHNAVVRVHILELNEYIDLKANEIEIENSYKTIFNRDIGTYTLQATVIAPNDKYLNSDISESIKITFLDEVKNLEHNVDGKKGIISFNKVEGANKYELTKLFGNETEDLTLNTFVDEGAVLKYQLDNIDGAFNKAGEYILKVKAINDTTGQNNHYYISSSHQIKVIRLPDVEVNTGEYKFSWNEVYNSLGYSYKFFKEGNEPLEDIKTNHLSFDFSTIRNVYGKYLFKVKALGNDKNILSSINYVTKEHKEYAVLEKPVLTFDKDTEILTILKNNKEFAVDNEIEYQLSCNEKQIVLVPSETEEELKYDISSLISETGVYTFTVKVLCNSEFLNSSVASIVIERLKAVDEINLTSNEIVVPTYNDGKVDEGILDAEKVLKTKPHTILINNVEKNIIDNSTSFVIKVNYNGIGKIDNVYYIDSPVSEFNIERITTPNKPVFLNNQITFNVWDKYSAKTYLIFNQETFVKPESLFVTNSPFDIYVNNALSDPLKGLNINEDLPIEVNVKYGFVSDNGVVNKNEVKYISSLLSEKLIVSKLNSVLNLKMEKDILNNNYKITWDKNLNAEKYIINIVKPDLSKEEEIITTENSYAYDFVEYGNYSVSVYPISKDYLQGNKETITVERLVAPTQVNVDANENLTIVNSVEESKISKVKVEYEILPNEKIELESLNLASLKENFSLYLTNIAKTDAKKKFYIDSNTSKFTFNRIQKIETLFLEDNKIFWTINKDFDKYMLKFKQGELEQYLTLTNEQIKNLFLDNDSKKGLLLNDVLMTNILGMFKEGKIEVSIRPLKNAISNMNPNETQKLSCLEYSSTVSINKLSAPTDFKVRATGKYSENVSVYFQYKDGFKDVEKIDVYENGVFKKGYLTNAIETELYLDVQSYRIDLTDMNVSKDYNLQFVAVGKDGAISSKKSQTVVITKLFAPNVNGISVDQKGNLLFEDITNASGYNVILTLNGEEPVDISINKNQNPLNIYEKLKKLGALVVGKTKIQIRTLGDGERYLNSNDSEVYEFTVMEKPTIVVKENSFSFDYSLNTTELIFTIKKGGIIVEDYKDVVLAHGKEWTIPTSFTSGEYEISAYVKSTMPIGFIPSEIITKTFIKLEEIQGHTFIKEKVAKEDKFVLRVNKNDFATSYGLLVNDGTEVYIGTLKESYVYFDIVGNLKEEIGNGIFRLNVFAIGGLKNGVNYTSSNISTITAEKLGNVKHFLANHTLTWENITNNNGYILTIASDENILAKDTTTFSLQGKNGELVLNIKALGNVNEFGVSENAILDSDFLPNNLTTTKIDNVTSFVVNEGYISFDYNENYDYEITVGENVYSSSSPDTKLMTYGETGENKVHFYNETLTNTLKPNMVHTMQIKAIAKVENVLDSDISEEVQIKILENTLNPVWTLNNEDLSKNYISWEDKKSNYLIKTNGTLGVTEINKFVPYNLPGGNFNFEIAIKGHSNLEAGVYVLSSKYVSKKFTILDTTSKISVQNGILSWEQVKDATNYLVYFKVTDNNFLKVQTNKTFLDETLPENFVENGKYPVYIQAVTTTKDYFQGKMFQYKDAVGGVIPVTKLKVPKDLTLNSGNLSYSEGLNIAGTDTPFTYNLKNALEQKLAYKFVSTSGAEYSFVIDALYNLNIDVQNILDSFGTFLSKEQKDFLEEYKTKTYGWPNIDRMFDEYGKNIPYGEYNLSIRQNGNNTDYLNSYYTNSMNVYVPKAPKLNISVENNGVKDIYYLNIEEVTLPNIQSSEVVYNVYGTYLENDVLKFDLLKSSNERKIDLSTILNKDKYKEIFCFVKGDNVSILNGKTSNKIALKYLKPVETTIKDGIISWTKQNDALGYEIKYNINASVHTVRLDSLTSTWIDPDWIEGQTYTNVNIQALGSQGKGITDSLVFPGEITPIGTITKLQSVKPYIENGVIYFDSILNSSKYKVAVSNGEDITLANTVDKIVFDPQIIGKIQYTFMTIGSENLKLGIGTNGYINSNNSITLKTRKEDAILNIKTKEGILIWDALKKEPGILYKLTFVKEGSENIVLVIDINQYDGYKKEDILENLPSGNYKVYVQAFKKETILNPEQDTEYFLLSKQQTDLDKNVGNITKLADIQNIQVISNNIGLKGEEIFSSTVTFKDDALDTKDGIYELTFISVHEHINIKILNTTNASDFIFNELDNTWSYIGIVDPEKFDIGTYNLTIRRITNKETEMNSNYLPYGKNEEYYEIIQINAITKTNIDIMKIDGNDEIIIAWNDYKAISTMEHSITDKNISYKFEYWSVNEDGTDCESKFIYTDNKYVKYNSLELDAQKDFKYRVQVCIGSAITNISDFINSTYSKPVALTRPEKVKNITYDNVAQSYSWEYTVASNDYSFKVYDYYLGENYGPITSLDNLANYGKPTEYNIPIKKGTNSYTFNPQKIGQHIISVVVMISNLDSAIEKGGMFMSVETFYINEHKQYNENFNLFAIGEGTKDNPYIITNNEQFRNINYRSVTPSYLGYNYYFKQTTALNITTDDFIKNEFDGRYDGNKQELTIRTTLFDLSLSKGVFGDLMKDAIVENLKVYLNITSEVRDNVSFGILTKNNFGTIQHITFGRLNQTAVNIQEEEIAYQIQMSLFAYNNYGNINNVINNYDININGRVINGEYGASIYVGAIACYNMSKIENSGNNGNITITCYEGATIGGLVAQSKSNDVQSNVQNEIVACYNKGNIIVNYDTKVDLMSSRAAKYYIGGLVGEIHNDNIFIRDSYAKCTVSMIQKGQSQEEVIYLGGMVGLMQYSYQVDNSFVQVETILNNVNTTKQALNNLFVGYIVNSQKTNNMVYYYSDVVKMNIAGGQQKFNSSNFTDKLETTKLLNQGCKENQDSIELQVEKFLYEEGEIILMFESKNIK